MNVSVDDDFARFGSKSYAINKINSVDVRERQPYSKGGAIVCGVIAVVLLLIYLGSKSDAQAPGFGMALVALAFAGLAYWQWQRAKIREYLMYLMTSSSETQAFISRDLDEVDRLRGQIESAMLRHSRAGTDR